MIKKEDCIENLQSQDGKNHLKLSQVICRFFADAMCHQTLHNDSSNQIMNCMECDIFDVNVKPDNYKKIFSKMNNELIALKNEVRKKDNELLTLNEGISESYQLLQKLSTGNLTSRISNPSRNESIGKLQTLLNLTVNNMQTMVDEHHELAMGICEHYDVLDKIAAGDFTAKALENSKNELVAKLGMLINKETSILTGLLKEINDTSIELAVGLSLNFEVLQNVANGNLTVSAPEDSENELLSKLGIVVNQTISKLKQSWDDLNESNQNLELELTERKRTELILEESEQKYSTIVENINVGIFRNTPGSEGRFIEANYAIIHMFGYKTKDEFIKTHVSELYKEPEKRKRFSKKMLEHGFVKDEELLLKRRDGSTFWGSVTAVVVYNDKGEIQCYDGMIEDISERKNAEKKQAQLLHELEKVNSELKDFAYIVSHDLKAPLRAIGSLVSWISTDYEDKFDEDGKETLTLLIGRVKRMNELIDGILQYSRVGRIREDIEEVDLNMLIKDVIDLVAPPKNIEVKIKTMLPTIKCEKTRIAQVFQNLISNAVKYMDKPEGRVEIRCKKMKDSWKFSVSDNGPGIEAKYHKKIFQIFQTLTPRDVVENTGIGLSLVKKIVELYKGKVWVESDVVSGSTFYFTFPR